MKEQRTGVQLSLYLPEELSRQLRAYAGQNNISLSRAASDWLLSVNPDEIMQKAYDRRLIPETEAEILHKRLDSLEAELKRMEDMMRLQHAESSRISRQNEEIRQACSDLEQAQKKQTEEMQKQDNFLRKQLVVKSGRKKQI